LSRGATGLQALPVARVLAAGALAADVACPEGDWHAVAATTAGSQIPRIRIALVPQERSAPLAITMNSTSPKST